MSKTHATYIGHPPVAYSGSISPSRYAPPPEFREQSPEVSNSHALKHMSCLQDLDISHPCLLARGIEKRTIREFGLGYCLKEPMSNRIVIPLHNAEGILIGFLGCAPHDQPDEYPPKLKLPESLTIRSHLFNLHRAMQRPAYEPLVLVEGLFDAIAMWQIGVKKVVAVMDETLSYDQQAQINKCFPSGSRMLLMFDEDDAGRRGRKLAMSRLCDRFYVCSFRFTCEGMRPKELTSHQIRQSGVF